jgi:hypothetical protein
MLGLIGINFNNSPQGWGEYSEPQHFGMKSSTAFILARGANIMTVWVRYAHFILCELRNAGNLKKLKDLNILLSS